MISIVGPYCEVSVGKLASIELALTPFSKGKPEHLKALPDEGSRSVSKQRPVVLMYGNWRELALYRAEVLRLAGFSVVAPTNREEALEVVNGGKYQVAILSYTLSSETVKEFSDLIRQNCPRCPIITIARSNSLDRHVSPDAVVLADLGPTALVTAIKQVLQKP